MSDARPPDQGVEQRLVAIGEWFADYECSACGKRYTVTSEEEIGFRHVCPWTPRTPYSAVCGFYRDGIHRIENYVPQRRCRCGFPADKGGTGQIPEGARANLPAAPLTDSGEGARDMKEHITSNERGYSYRFAAMWHELIGSPLQHTLHYTKAQEMMDEADREIERLKREREVSRHETHDPPHCPTCECDQETVSNV